MMKSFMKYLILFWVGGSIYLEIELLYRGYSFWAMFALGGVIFVLCGLLNNLFDWEMDLGLQVLIGTVITTLLEFISGCILNLGLGLNMWDYSNVWGNLCGQVCVPFILLWIPLVLIAIVLDDIIRYVVFNEELPHYWIGNRFIELDWLYRER